MLFGYVRASQVDGLYVLGSWRDALLDAGQRSEHLYEDLVLAGATTGLASPPA